MSAKRLGSAVSKVGLICREVMSEVQDAMAKLPEVNENLDTVVGGAHERATRPEIEAMTIALDDAVTEGEIVTRHLMTAVAKMREVRGRLDRAMQAYRVAKRDEPVVAAETPPPPRRAWLEVPAPVSGRLPSNANIGPVGSGAPRTGHTAEVEDSLPTPSALRDEEARPDTHTGDEVSIEADAQRF